MKKTYIQFVLFFIAFASCTENTHKEVDTKEYRELSFSVAWQTDVFPSTKAEDPALYLSRIEMVGLADDEKYLHESYERENVGNTFPFSNIKVPYGENRFYVIGHNGTSMTDDNGTARFEKILDTFFASYDVTVDASTPIVHNITLRRAVSKIEIQSTDGLPENVGGIEVIVNGYLDGLDMYASEKSQPIRYVRDFAYGESQRNGKGIKHSVYSFVDGETLPVSIEIRIYDLTGKTLWLRNLGEVNLPKNRIVRFTGELYGPDTAENFFQIGIEAEWDGTDEYEF